MFFMKKKYNYISLYDDFDTNIIIKKKDIDSVSKIEMNKLSLAKPIIYDKLFQFIDNSTDWTTTTLEDDEFEWDMISTQKQQTVFENSQPTGDYNPDYLKMEGFVDVENYYKSVPGSSNCFSESDEFEILKSKKIVEQIDFDSGNHTNFKCGDWIVLIIKMKNGTEYYLYYLNDKLSENQNLEDTFDFLLSILK